jgi:hypothetical protein
MLRLGCESWIHRDVGEGSGDGEGGRGLLWRSEGRRLTCASFLGDYRELYTGGRVISLKRTELPKYC